MSHLAYRPAVALVTFTVGVALAWLTLSSPYPLAVSELPSPHLRFTSTSPAPPAPVPAQSNSLKLADLCSSGDALNYKGVEIKRSWGSDRTSTITISRNGKLLARPANGEGRSCIALAPLLGGEDMMPLPSFKL